MKLLYKPFGIVAGIVGAKLGQSLFKSVWTKFDEAEPPRPKTEEASLGKVVVASAVEAAMLAGIGAAVDRMVMRWFHYLTGIWPGDTPEDTASARAAD